MKIYYVLGVLGVLGIIAFAALSGNQENVTPPTEPDQNFLAESRSTPRIIPDVPRDAIPPLYSPPYVSLSDAQVEDDDIVLGFELNGDARAYPVKIMNWHEIVNDEIGGENVVVTYCPLCRSGIVFSGILDGKQIVFGNTGALYESAMVMYDHETDSQWAQVGGLALTGPLKGKRLTVLPSNTVTFGEWKKLHPDTLILSRDLGYSRNYDADFSADRLDLPPGWPISHHDDRLRPREKILGVEVGGVHKAYSLTLLKKAVVNDEVNEQPLVVFSTVTESGFVYDRELDGQVLDFVMEEGEIQDQQTGSVWDLSGTAVSGQLKGKKLVPYPSTAAFWFSWATTYPETEIWS